MVDPHHIRQQLEALDARALELYRQLFLSSVDDTLPQGSFYVLTCKAADERVAFVLNAVDEVLPMASLSPIPGAPKWVRGNLNLRGTLIPVVDLAARLHHSESEVGVDDFIVITRVEDRCFGFIVNKVFDVSRAVEIDKPPTEIPYARYILGIMPGEQRSAMLLSVPRLVALSEIPA